MIDSIVSDVRCNRSSGLFTVIFLVNYRFGRYFLEKKNRCKLFFIPYAFCYVISRFLSLFLGCSLPFSAEIGREVLFKHGLFGVFISGMAKVGDNSTIFHHVTIGSNYGSKRDFGAPNIGNGVLIGAGAKVIGPVKVETGAVIPAGSVIIFGRNEVF